MVESDKEQRTIRKMVLWLERVVSNANGGSLQFSPAEWLSISFEIVEALF
jgi:hypothetical protein